MQGTAAETKNVMFEYKDFMAHMWDHTSSNSTKCPVYHHLDARVLSPLVFILDV